eukprot:3603500-Rhodomonas_salina.1
MPWYRTVAKTRPRSALREPQPPEQRDKTTESESSSAEDERRSGAGVRGAPGVAWRCTLAQNLQRHRLHCSAPLPGQRSDRDSRLGQAHSG